MSTSCGKLIASVQKDRWSYAIDAGNGIPGPPSMRWQFPPTGLTSFEFLNAIHQNDDYRRPGAAWNDVFIVRTGGETVATVGEVGTGYTKLHALNACARTEGDRVRWITDLANFVSSPYHALGSPSVTGGIVFVGTNKGHLIVLADPTVVPATQWVCSNIYYSLLDCAIAWPKYQVVPSLLPLRDIEMPDQGSLAEMRNEPVLAKGRVFVSTCRNPNDKHSELNDKLPKQRCDDGRVYMLDTEPR
jgi:hypothetical protein